MIQRVYYVKEMGRYFGNMFPILIQEIGAYMSYEAAKIAIEEYINLYGKQYSYIIESSEMEGSLIGDEVLYMRLYQGYDHNYNTGTILSMCSYVGLYPNLETLQNTKLYKDYLEKMKSGNPDDFLQLPDGSFGYRDTVCKNDLYSDGDHLEDKFSLHVEKLRLYRGEDRYGIIRHIRQIIEGG